MQRLFFEKQIDLKHTLKELVSISVNENLSYLDDPLGRRAKGTLDISGEYVNERARKRFTDAIEIDILAPFERMEKTAEFRLEIQDFDYHIQNGDLQLEIQVLAHGVLEKTERRIVVDEMSEDEKVLLEEIQNMVSKQELIEAMEENLESENNAEESEPTEELSLCTASLSDVEEKPKLDENIEMQEERAEEMIAEESKEEQVLHKEDVFDTVDAATAEINEIEPLAEIETLADDGVSAELVADSNIPMGSAYVEESEDIDVEDLFDDDSMDYVTYPIYIVKKQDSYESIAQKYQVDTQQLMDYNHRIELSDALLLMIPPR